MLSAEASGRAARAFHPGFWAADASTAPASAPDAGAHSAPAHAGPGSSLRPPSNPASGKAVLGSDRLHIGWSQLQPASNTD